jgi:hypothetical protein
MGVRIGRKQSHGAGEHRRLLGTARAFLAPIAGQRVQGGTADAGVRIVEHRNQVVHDLLGHETIEEQAAVMAHLGALVAKAFATGGKRVETGAEQGAIGRPGAMGNR